MMSKVEENWRVKAIFLNILYDTEHQYSPLTYTSPERRLLLAILFRAFLDLGKHAAPLDRKSAIRWFRARVDYSPLGITFHQVIQEFGLANWCLDQLEVKIKEAESYETERREEAKRKGEVISMFHPPFKQKRLVPYRVMGNKLKGSDPKTGTW